MANIPTAAKPAQLINVSVASGQTYVFTAGAGTLDVSHQADHYQISQTGSDDNGSAIYEYNSSPGYVGSDEVTLIYNSKSEAGGCPQSQNKPNSSSSVIALRFSVTK